MLSLVAAAAAAALAQAVPTIEAFSQTADGRQIVRLSFEEMASVSSAPLSGPVTGRLATQPVRLEGSAFAFETGVRNIVVNHGIGSNSQAVTSVSVTVGLPSIGP
jgi:hypothetical protein